MGSDRRPGERVGIGVVLLEAIPKPPDAQRVGGISLRFMTKYLSEQHIARSVHSVHVLLVSRQALGSPQSQYSRFSFDLMPYSAQASQAHLTGEIQQRGSRPQQNTS